MRVSQPVATLPSAAASARAAPRWPAAASSTLSPRRPGILRGTRRPPSRAPAGRERLCQHLDQLAASSTWEAVPCRARGGEQYRQRHRRGAEPQPHYDRGHHPGVAVRGLLPRPAQNRHTPTGRRTCGRHLRKKVPSTATVTGCASAEQVFHDHVESRARPRPISLRRRTSTPAARPPPRPPSPVTVPRSTSSACTPAP